MLRVELRFASWSRTILVVLVVFFAGAVGATLGLVSHVSSQITLFQRSLAEAAANGVSLETALATPVHIADDGQGGQLIDNILRYDFESAQRAVTSLSTMGYCVNALQFLSFVVIPTACVVMAVLLSTRDYRDGTLKIRASRSSLSQIQFSQWATVQFVALFSVLLSLVVAAVSGEILSRAMPIGHVEVLASSAPGGVGWGELAATFLLSAFSIAFFGTVGFGAGLVFRRALIPIVVFVVWNTMCPLLGNYDPRVLWLTWANHVFQLKGAFDPTVVSSVGLVSATVILVVLAASAAAVGHVVSRRVSRYSGAGR